MLDDFSTGHLHRIESEAAHDIGTQRIGQLGVVLFLSLLAGTGMMMLDVIDFTQRLLMGRHPLYDADAGDDRLVLLQTIAEINHCTTDDNHQQTQPEGEAPLTPLERIILYTLCRIELVRMHRIYRNGEHLQRQRISVIALAVDLHIECRNHIHLLIERGKRIVAAHLDAIITHLHRVALALLHHLYTRYNLVLRLEGWQHNSGTLPGCSLEVQDGLLSDKQLQGIHALLHGLTESQRRATHQRHRQYDILYFHVILL